MTLVRFMLRNSGRAALVCENTSLQEGLQHNVSKSANNAGARSDGGSDNEEDTLIKQWTDD